MSDRSSSSRLWSTAQKLRACAGRLGSFFIDLLTEARDPHETAWRLVAKANKELLETLRIREPHARDFFDCFRFVDTDASDTIEYEEFVDFFNVGDSKFLQRFYKDYDVDNSGGIDFEEFVVATWNLCSRTRRGLMRYMFDIFDDDKNGWLSPPEIVALVKLVYPKDTLVGTGRIEAILATIDTDNDGQVSFAELVEFFERNPAVLAPLFEMQRKLHHGICSPSWWRLMADWRVLQFGEHSVIEDILGTRSKMREQLKAAKRDEQQAALEEAQSKMADRAAERIRQALQDSRKITRLEYVKLVVAWAEKRYFDLRSDTAADDVHKTAFLKQSSAALARASEIEKEVAEVWELKFEKLASDVIKGAEQAASDFLDSPIGNRVVENAATALLAKSQQETLTSGSRLDMTQAKQLVRSKLKDTLVAMSQDQVQVDRKQMIETRDHDIQLIKGQMDEFALDPLERVMAGDERLIALVADMAEAEVRDLKGLDGGWFDNMLLERAKAAAPPRKSAISHRRASGTFATAAELEFERAHLADSCAQHSLPMCPKCSSPGSLPTSRFCRFCRSQLWRRLHDQQANCLYYRSCIDNETTYHSPFTEEYERQLRSDAEPDLGGLHTTNVDQRLVGLTAVDTL